MKTASAQNDGTVSPDTPQDREQQLNQLLNRIKGRPTQLASAARVLSVEVDGEVIGHTETSAQAVYFGLPGEARSVSLKDENGVVRAHVLLAEQDVANLDFDRGRITMSIEESDNPAPLRLVVCCNSDEQP